MSSMISEQYGTISTLNNRKIFQALVSDPHAISIQWNTGSSIKSEIIPVSMNHEESKTLYILNNNDKFSLVMIYNFDVANQVRDMYDIDVPFAFIMMQVTDNASNEKLFIPFVFASDILLTNESVDFVNMMYDTDMLPFDQYTINSIVYTDESGDNFFHLQESFNVLFAAKSTIIQNKE